MADFLFTSGITGNFSGGGKLAANLSLGIMGSNAAAGTTVDALNRGLSNRQALTLGAIAGVAEIVTEKVSLETLLDKTALDKSRLGYFLKNVIAEGSEEATSDVINWVADIMVSRDKSEWRQAIAAYQAQGMNENEAFFAALTDQAKSIGLDALGGAVSGGVMAGGRVAMDMHQDRVTGRDIRQSMKRVDGVYQAVIDTGLESGADTDAYHLAEKNQRRLDKKGELSDGQLGRQYRANMAAIEAEESVDTIAEQNPVEDVKNVPTGSEAVAARLGMMREHAKIGFGPSGEAALLDVYDKRMAAEIDPAEAYGVFSRAYTAAMMGQEAAGVDGAPKMLVEAAQIAAKYDLRAAQGTQPKVEATANTPGFYYDDAATRQFVATLPTEVEERMDTVARDLGLTIRAVDSVFGGQANAQITGSEILIDKNVTTDGVSYILGHEFTHRMEEFWQLPGQKATYADRQWRQREELKRRHMAEIRDAVQAEREKGKVQEKKLKDWYKERDAAIRDRKSESEARNRLLKLAARMKRMPVDNTNKTLIRELVGDLDTEARHLTGKKLTELTELRRWYEGKTTTGSDTYDPNFISDQRTADNLRRLEMKHIDDMTLQDVKDLTQILLNLENEIRTSKRLIGEKESRDVYQLGEQTIKDIRAVKGGKKSGAGAVLDKLIVTETLSPLRQVRRMVGYQVDSPLVKLTEGLADGQRKMMDYQMRAEKPFERFAAKADFTKRFSGKDAETVKISGWVGGKLQEVEITPAMRVSLWLHSQNEQNLLHMRDGGVRVPDLELYRKGKLADAYAAGTVMKVSPEVAKGLWQQMTTTERAFAKEVQRYFSEVSKPDINEVSRQLKGYDIAEVENYYPIRTDKTFDRAELETLKFDGTIEGMGFLKERQNFAHNPMYLEDVNTVLEQAIRMHGKYVGLAIPVRNFGKVWNVSTAVQTEDGQWSSYGDSVQNAVQAVWGKTGYDYITKMMTDLQGGGKQAPAWAKTFGKVRSNYAGAVLTLNASVALKQAASYPTAAAVLGWRPLVKAMGDVGKVDLDLIAKYTPLQWYRSKGFATKELGDIQNYGGVMKEVLGVKGLNWVQGIDLVTTRKLWKASEYYVRENSPSLEIGSEAYYQTVADIYNRVIEETQPNYTTMQRPQMLRSDDTLMGNLAMFKTQPFQNFNILYDAAGEYRAVMERAKTGGATQSEIKAAKVNLSRAATSQLAQLAVFAAMTMAWGMFRGRKDNYEDDKGDVTLWSVLGGLGKDMLGGTAAMIPFGTEVYEFSSSKIFGERYYGIEPVSVEAISNAVTSLSKLGDTIWGTTKNVLKGENVDWESVLHQVDDSADDISKVAGVPYENVTNLFNAVARWALIGAKGKYLGEYAAMRLTHDKGKNSTKYMDLLYDAMENSREDYNALWSQMVKDGWTNDQIKRAMEKRMKDAQGVTEVSELEERYIAPEEREVYERAVEKLTKSAQGKKATAQQLKDAKVDAYEFVTRAGGEDEQKRWDSWEAAGMDAGTYALYQLAEEMADQPNEKGKLGTITNEEREAAIRSLGMSKRDNAALWVLAGGSEKSNPWR